MCVDQLFMNTLKKTNWSSDFRWLCNCEKKSWQLIWSYLALTGQPCWLYWRWFLAIRFPVWMGRVNPNWPELILGPEHDVGKIKPNIGTCKGLLFLSLDPSAQKRRKRLKPFPPFISASFQNENRVKEPLSCCSGSSEDLGDWSRPSCFLPTKTMRMSIGDGDVTTKPGKRYVALSLSWCFSFVSSLIFFWFRLWKVTGLGWLGRWQFGKRKGVVSIWQGFKRGWGLRQFFFFSFG